MNKKMNLTSSDLKDLQNATTPIIKEAGKYILQFWNKTKNISFKDKRDVVSNVDVEVEENVRSKLKKIFPQAGFIVEEGETEKLPLYNWAIDPVNGTKNYVAQLPMFSTQIALLEKDNPILGHVYYPVVNHFFSASLGNGVSLNGNKIVIHDQRGADESIIDIDFGGHDVEIDWKLEIFKKLSKSFFRVRVFGDVVTSYLVTGAIDAFVALNAKVKVVDLVPNIILAREAGLRSDYINLKNNRKILISANKTIFVLIEKIINSIRYV